ncbi:MAG: NAD-dependent epimerase [Phycisphaerae bacterium]|nr:NAD-dependent epimerase [Phycisphaerae bacterium]
MKILVTGTAGFIGSAVSRKLLERGDEVVGVDNLNDYYDVNLKLARLKLAEDNDLFSFQKLDVSDINKIKKLFENEQFDKVVHLAAQAGVRYSIENPQAYINCNIVGFTNILEGCRHNNVQHLVYASSSSVYGSNTDMPLSVHDNVDHPMSLYAATKKSNELMAHAYSNLFDLPTTGLRFFTVYGPWGRPDMALFLFTKAILAGEKLPVFNYGKHTRDFTYIDDIVEGVIKTLDKTAMANPNYDSAKPDPGTSSAPWRVYNIGGGKPVDLLKYIHCIEASLEKKVGLELLPLQPGDIPNTEADVEALKTDVGFMPDTPVELGIQRFVDWYQEYYLSNR